MGISLFAALVAWRYSQGIYHFDEELLNSLVSAGLDSSLTLERLASLPEYCVFISLPKGFLETLPDTTGTLAYYDFNFSTEQLVLRLEMFTDEHALGSIVLPIEEGVSIQEGMRRRQQSSRAICSSMGRLRKHMAWTYFRSTPRICQSFYHLCCTCALTGW